MADEPERVDLFGAEPDLVAEQRDRIRPDRSADLAVHLGERRTNDLEHLGSRDAPAVDEGRHDPSAFHLGSDLRPCPVDDDDVVPGRAQGDASTAASAATRPPSLTTTRLMSCTPR